MKNGINVLLVWLKGFLKWRIFGIKVVLKIICGIGILFNFFVLNLVFVLYFKNFGDVN